MQTKDLVLKALRTVETASKFNFQPFLYDSAKTLTSALQHPTNILNSLLEDKLIRRVPLTPLPQDERKAEAKYTRKTSFYTPIGSRPKYISIGDDVKNPMAHYSAVRDVVLGLFWKFNKEWSINVQYEYPVYIVGSSKPKKIDALVIMDHIGGRNKTILVEVEKSRSPGAVYTDKYLKIHSKIDYKKSGLHPLTKSIIYYAHNTLDVFDRPFEYREDRFIANGKRCLELAKRMDKPNMLVANYMNFHKQHDKIFINGKGESNYL